MSIFLVFRGVFHGFLPPKTGPVSDFVAGKYKKEKNEHTKNQAVRLHVMRWRWRLEYKICES